MESDSLLLLIESLDENIDDLEEALAPFFKQPVPGTAKSLPLLDQAQFFVLVTYAIESSLFCMWQYLRGSRFLSERTYLAYLRLHGVNAKEHPIFRELTRVKQYFEKIKIVQSKGITRDGGGIDKAAAARFIKHALVKHDIPHLNLRWSTLPGWKWGQEPQPNAATRE